MLSSLVRGQLVAFLVVTLAALTYISASYLRLPELLGFGGYTVSMELAEASGLYPNANVTYRGYEVGRVGDLEIRPEGITVELNITEGAEIPADSIAEVHSTSAIGEQYVNFVPQGKQDGLLRDGDVIPADRTSVPVSTPQLLEGVHALVQSVPRESLRVTVDELYRAFNGSGRHLDGLLDAGSRLVGSAEENLPSTVDLIDALVPVLGTQERVSSDMKSYSRDLNSFTGQLVESDDHLRGMIKRGSSFAGQVTGVVNELGSSLPTLMADLASTGQVLRVYIPGIEHILIVYPAALQSIQTAAAGPPSQYTGEEDDPLDIPHAAVNFKLGMNAPPICVEGFEYAKEQRDPNDLDPAPLSDTSYCKVAEDDPRDVRGSRNLPCPNDPEKRSPDAKGCGLVFPRFSASGAGEHSVLSAPHRSFTAAPYDEETGRVMAPDGQFYLLTDVSETGANPQTWQELLTAPLGL